MNKKGIHVIVAFLLIFIIAMLLFAQIQDKVIRYGAFLFGGILLGSPVIAFSLLMFARKPKKDSFTYNNPVNKDYSKSNDVLDKRAFKWLLVREGNLTGQMADEVVDLIQNTSLPKATIMSKIRFNADYCISCYGFANGLVKHSFILGVLQSNGVITTEELQLLQDELKNKAANAAFKQNNR